MRFEALVTRRCVLGASLLSLGWLVCGVPASVSAESVALVGAAIVQPDGSIIPNGVLLIVDDHIEALGSADEVTPPSSATVVDASGTWLVPGLMNMHVHFGLVLPGVAGAALANETEPELVLRMAMAAKASLLAGVTTVRTTGERAHADIALGKAIDRGELLGPRIFSAGEQVGVSGGHGAGPEENDGPYEFRKAVRKEIRAGASWIKIAISGGIATPGGDIAASHMTLDEMEAVTEIAHRHSVLVTAHSGSPEASAEAIQAGVDCIEHGYFLTREVFSEMKTRGTWYVPTIVVSQPATMPFFERIGSPPWYLERVKSVGKRHWISLETAIGEGVSIALGTDQLPHEENDGTTATVREAEYYVAAGMTPLEALQAATIQPARMLKADAELGSLEAGKLADIIAVGADPTADIGALRDIRLVIKNGEVVRNDLSNP